MSEPNSNAATTGTTEGAASAGAASGGAGGSASPPGAAAPSSEPWYAPLGLDDQARQFIAGKGFQNISDLVKSGMEADRMVRDRNIMTAPDADPAKRKDWDGYERLGWNKDRGQYAVEAPKVPEGKNYDTAAEKAFLDAAHGARIAPWQAKEMLDAMAAFGFKAQDDAEAKGALDMRQLDEALKKEWGADYATHKARAESAARYMGIGVDDASQLEKVLGAPGLVKHFAKLGAMLGEDTLKGGAAGGAARGGLTADGAAAEMSRLSGDKEFQRALKDPSHPQHAQNVARWNALIDRKHGR
jgi:hypothetical protein